ncbi:putative 37s ribosomal protein s5 [Golovinomyces cichoracearum]|uniref:Putative 37s ribosomal protein s5 n=1 Tax=Golovinomyces cichoracearum TaxID=62708 RepID=A0A420HBR1_9PEZI|nr:putative 37s ribosomal protein s5 [Golovinomyces cichoracearum]
MCTPQRGLHLVRPWVVPLFRVQARNGYLHTSPKSSDKVRRKIRVLKKEDMQILKQENSVVPARELFPEYDAADMQALRNIYTNEQLEAIEAGEKAIDPEDLKTQGVLRHDMGALEYFDNLDKSRASLDRKKEYDGPYDPELREANLTENIGAAIDAAAEVLSNEPDSLEENNNTFKDPESSENYKPPISRLNVWRIQDTMSLAMGKNGPIPRDDGQVQDFTAPGLPRNFLQEKKKGPSVQVEIDPRDPDGIYTKLIAQTGLTLDEILAYRIKVLVQHRVSNQTRLGKVPGQYVLAIAGNNNGRLGIGEAKGGDGGQALNLAKISAIRNMQPIPRYENRTIYGEVDAKVSAVRVKLMARPPGFGLRCQHLIFEMARAAGIDDLAARVPHARNKMNTCKAVYKALLNQPIPDEIARGRGKKLVDVRKVYYGAQV